MNEREGGVGRCDGKAKISGFFFERFYACDCTSVRMSAIGTLHVVRVCSVVTRPTPASCLVHGQTTATLAYVTQ